MKLAIRIVLLCVIFPSGRGLAQQPVPQGNLIHTVVGNGTSGFSGDGGQATSAQLNGPRAVAADAAGAIYIADEVNNRVRKVTPGGIISTVAGNGGFGFSGDGGQATSAQLMQPVSVAVGAAGDLYIADFQNNRIRKVTPGGIISTVAGNGATGFSGDGGLATAAQLNRPLAVRVDAAGYLYIADYGNSRVRKVTPGGVISTIAGTGTSGFSGDGGQATSAQLALPRGIAVDAAGVVYINDVGNYRVRKVSLGGVISTVAGNGTPGFSGDGGAATSARLSISHGIAVDAGSLYIADSSNNRVRKVTPNGVISTVAGNGTSGFSGDGGPATSAQITSPTDVGLDSAGVLFFSDYANNRVRRVGTRSRRDFNRDGKTDILWRDAAGNISMWLMNGTTVADDAFIASVAPAWKVAGSGDFDGNGTADIIWRDTAGNVSIWLMDGITVTSFGNTGTVALAWSISGVADFNGDGRADILWRDDSGNVAIWFMSGNSIVDSALVGNVTGWTIIGTGDFDGDGKGDILWRDTAGNVAIWLMNGFSITSYRNTATVALAWGITGTGDFNDDGKSDILWRDTAGNVAVWLMNGDVIANGILVANVSPVWAITGTGDFNGDGRTDILWQSAAGSASIWLMDVNIVTSHPDLGSVSGRIAQ